jgi:hypothetical protein
MVKFPRRLGLICCLALAGIFNLSAQNFSGWRIGDIADRDIAAPAPLDVVDAAATAARQAAAALKTPAIFRVNSSVSNAMTLKVTAAFAEAHSNFLAGLQQTYRQTTLDDATIQSADFGYFLTAFNFKNKKFPITTPLAQQWARGESGLAAQTNLIRRLLELMRQPVRPDKLPDGVGLGDTVRLVSVHSSRDVLSPDKVEQQGALVSPSSLTTLTHLRSLFRRDFPPEDQLIARALANYLHPNCELDTNLTREIRARATSRIIVADHYDAGQIIVRRGQKIDAKALAALAQLGAAAPKKPLPAPIFRWLPIFAVVFIAAAFGLWRWRRARRRSAATLVRLADSSAQKPSALPPELAPQLAETLKAAVVQELAAQRRELLQTQQIAATEILRLMQRLNELHAPLPERLGVYEKRIQELEKELAARTEENRELLKLKIDLLRQQLESERAPQPPRVHFN